MYSVISVILGIVTTIFTGYCLSGYYDSFVEKNKSADAFITLSSFTRGKASVIHADIRI